MKYLKFEDDCLIFVLICKKVAIAYLFPIIIKLYV